MTENPLANLSEDALDLCAFLVQAGVGSHAVQLRTEVLEAGLLPCRTCKKPLTMEDLKHTSARECRSCYDAFWCRRCGGHPDDCDCSGKKPEPCTLCLRPMEQCRCAEFGWR